MVIHSVTTSEKAQVEGSLRTRPAAAAGRPAGAMVFARGRPARLDLRQVHARSIAGTCQVHHCLYPGAARAGVVRFCGPLADHPIAWAVMRCPWVSNTTGVSSNYKAMAASVPRRMNGPSGRWLVRPARCRASSAAPYIPARTNAAKVPDSSACQLIQPSAAPTLAASLASPRPSPHLVLLAGEPSSLSYFRYRPGRATRWSPGPLPQIGQAAGSGRQTPRPGAGRRVRRSGQVHAMITWDMWPRGHDQRTARPFKPRVRATVLRSSSSLLRAGRGTL